MSSYRFSKLSKNYASIEAVDGSFDKGLYSHRSYIKYHIYQETANKGYDGKYERDGVQWRREQVRVVHCPNSSSLSIRSVRQKLRERGIVVDMVEWFGKQSPYSFSQLFWKKIKGCDILHFHWMPFNRFFTMKMVEKLTDTWNIPMVWTIHNLVPHAPQYGSQATDRTAMHYMAEWAAAGVVHCEETKQEFVELYGNPLPLYVVPYGNFIEHARFQPAAESREKLGISDGRVVLFLFPPNRWSKGIETFVEVVEQLPDEYVGLLAGSCDDPSIQRYLERKARERPEKFITNIGYIPFSDIGYFFGASDVFFMPFQQITTSSSIMYAMSHKKAIVSVPQGHLQLLVQDGVNGYLCRDVNEMVSRIISIDRPTAKEMGMHSYEIAQQYTWDDYVDRLIDIYERYTGATDTAQRLNG